MPRANPAKPAAVAPNAAAPVVEAPVVEAPVETHAATHGPRDIVKVKNIAGREVNLESGTLKDGMEGEATGAELVNYAAYIEEI